MNDYDLKITPSAQQSLHEIVRYVAQTLRAPQAAADMLTLLQREMQSLSALPARFPLTPEEPWHERGVRTMPVKNFIIYYWIDEAGKTVHILHLLYARRDQKTQLENLEPDQ